MMESHLENIQNMEQTPDERQLCAIADELAQTSQNIYRVAEEILGYPVGEEIFAMVEAQGIFKCKECSFWRAHSERSWLDAETCEECENDSLYD